MAERLDNRQGLLARTNDDAEEEIIIDLSDDSDTYSSSSYTSSECNSDDENGRQDFENLSDHFSIEGSQHSYRGGQFAAAKNVQPSKGSSKNKPFWNSEKNQGHVNWSDEVDDTPRGYIDHPPSSTDGTSQKRSRKSSERREGFGRRSNDHSASVDDKWTHDLFEQHANSDGERGVAKSRKGKSSRTKKTSSSKKSFSKELRLKKIAATPSEPLSSAILVDSDSAPNWAATVASEEAASSKSLNLQKNDSISTTGAISGSEMDVVLSETESQVPERIIAELSIDSSAPEIKSVVSASVVSTEPDSSIEQAPSQTDAPVLPTSTRTRRVISQASKNQLMASFNRPGGILFRSALTAAGASTPVPRTASPLQQATTSAASATSSTSATSVSVEKNNEMPLETSVTSTIPIESSAGAPKEQRSAKLNKEQRDLRDTLSSKDSLKEFTLQKATTPSKEINSNRETPSYQKDREPRSNRGIRTKESEQKERPTSSRENSSRGVDYSIRRNSTQDSRDSIPSRNGREQNVTPAQEKQHHERFVVEKRSKNKKTIEYVSKDTRRREGNFSKSDIAPEPQQVNDMEPKVVATSTGWALVTPATQSKAAESGKEARSKRSDRNEYSKSGGKYDNTNINATTNNTNNSRSYKSKRQQQNNIALSAGSDSVSSILPYTPAVQPMINVQPMMTQSGHMVLLTEDGLCVPATPGMFQYQQWYDTSVAPSPVANQTYPTYYTENYYASPSSTKDK